MLHCHESMLPPMHNYNSINPRQEAFLWQPTRLPKAGVKKIKRDQVKCLVPRALYLVSLFSFLEEEYHSGSEPLAWLPPWVFCPHLPHFNVASVLTPVAMNLSCHRLPWVFSPPSPISMLLCGQGVCQKRALKKKTLYRNQVKCLVPRAVGNQVKWSVFAKIILIPCSPLLDFCENLPIF